MGPFADTLFAALLGWLRTAARNLWQLIQGGDASRGLQWLLENWLPLTIILCLCGLAIDLVVYLLRWQPWRVWRSWLHRKREEPLPEENQPAWVYADGTVRRDAAFVQQPEEEPRLEAPIRQERRALRARPLGDPEQTYHQPYYPPQWQGDTSDESTSSDLH